MKKYTLYELQLYLQRVISLNFAQPLWVTAEVAHLKRSRGHIYLELVQKKEGEKAELCAQCQSVIWSRNLRKIAASLPIKMEELLEEGREISVLVELGFHPVYGLKMSVLDIDLNYTLGQIALMRQQTIERLNREGLIQLNKSLVLPEVLQRIAVISSESAAGYQDFVTHLQQNENGYKFEITLFPSALQGKMLESELKQSLAVINAATDRYDCIAIIRGGGSKLDLSGFDQYQVARSIANSNLPILTGIGHDMDQSVSDIVAHLALKTPTAVAHFIIDRNEAFETQVLQYRLEINGKMAEIHQEQRDQLNHHRQSLRFFALNFLKLEQQHLLNATGNLGTSAMHQLHHEHVTPQHLIDKINILNPKTMLSKGYSLTFLNGKPVTSIAGLSKDHILTTLLSDGKVHSKIESVES